MTRLTVFKLFLLVIAAVGAYFLALVAVDAVETRKQGAVEELLVREGLDWAEVAPDGMLVVLSGTAPDEAARFRAITLASQVTNPDHVRDHMTVIPREEIPQVAFRAEILRNDDRVTLHAMVPSGADAPLDLTRRLRELPGVSTVVPIVTEALAPAPESWEAAAEIALEAIAGLHLAQVEVTPERVAVDGVVPLAALEDGFDPKAWEQGLMAHAPEGVAVEVSLRVPRRHLAPFPLRLAHGGETLDLQACAVETEEDAAALAAALEAAGGAAARSCEVALGAPDGDWTAVGMAAIAAMAELGTGELVISDIDLTLYPGDAAPEKLDAARTALEAALPAAYRLAILEPEGRRAEKGDGPQLRFELAEDGTVTLSGPVSGPEYEGLLAALAGRPSGGEQLQRRLTVAEDLPATWNTRAMAAARALTFLTDGTVTVTPASVRVEGRTAREAATAELTDMLAQAFAPEVTPRINVLYVPELEHPVGPDPELCVRRINGILLADKITFAPGETTLDDHASAVVDRIAELLKECPEIPMEIGGHTDNQGSEEMNERLSRARAEAVLAAIASRGVLVSQISAKGYGETRPIADNSTEQGREANRRIAVRLTNPEEAPGTETGAETQDGSD